MKRVIICGAILLALVSVSLYAHFRVTRLEVEMISKIEALTPIMESGDNEELAEQMSEFVAFWEKEEDMLIHFVRHSHIDTVTTSMARLPSLAAHGDLGEVGAELANVRRQMEHIKNSERLTFSNLF